MAPFTFIAAFAASRGQRGEGVEKETHSAGEDAFDAVDFIACVDEVLKGGDNR